MLNLQELLRNDINGIEYLKNDLGIRVFEHPNLPLLGFKYSQIDSPRKHPIVRECRGIILEKDSYDLVAKPFNRFFNLGEDIDELNLFNWSNFYCNEKCDGSLCCCWYYYQDWHISTSGSFGLGEINYTNITWHDLFWKTSHIDRGKLDKRFTYVFELCSLHNKVIREYLEPKAFLLSMFAGEDEMDVGFVEEVASLLDVPRPIAYHFSNIDEIDQFLIENEKEDPTFEGLIIRDDKNLRFKIKSRSYLLLHKIKGESGNIFHPKYLLPYILAHEDDELLAYFNEIREIYDKYKKIVYDAFDNLKQVWQETHLIENQKEFALTIKNRTPFSGLLFRLRQELGTNQTLDDLKAKWIESENVILKILF